MRLSSCVVALAALAGSVLGARIPDEGIETRQTSEKYVFAHFILGIVASYVQSDWENDMTIAQSIGIDGFALDIGTDSYTTQQLEYAYAAAAAVGFKLFISFDFSYYNNGDVDTIAGILNQFNGESAQFTYNGAPFVSTFIGDGFPWTSVEAETGNLFTCPNWQQGSFGDDNSDCGFSWLAWPSTDNQPIDSNLTTAGDESYLSALGSKPYMMPVSPWFNTHYGPNSYNKNWIFYSDYLFQPRWDQVLQLSPPLVEIITWNDFSESHYIGPLHPDDTSVYAGGDTGAIQWVTNMPHDAWRDVAAVYISAYKAGASSPTVNTDELVYYYRPTPKDTSCSDPVPQPTGYEYDDDSIFVTALLTSAGTVTVTSGSNAPVSINVDAGVNTIAVPMGVGSQSFSLTRNGATVLSGTSPLDVSSSCTVYNFNAYTGSILA